MNEFHEFYHKTEEAYHKFHALQTETVLIKEEDSQAVAVPIKEELDELCEEKATQIEVEIEPNIPSYEQDGPVNATKNPLDNDHPSEEDDASEYECENDGLDACISNSSSSTTSSSDDEKVATKKETLKKVRKKSTAKIRKKTEHKKDADDEVTRKKRKRLDPKLTEEMIQKHIPMICNLCNLDCKTFLDIGTHFKEQHPKIKPFIVCCNKRFTRRHYIAQHALQHEDPNCFR